MTELYLTRQNSTNEGTPGILRGPDWMLFTVELPWRGNACGVSCIPIGSYVCRPYSSARYSAVYGLDNVPGRSAILIHAGNWAGDTSLGFLSDSQGCILPGRSRGQARGQLAVLDSAAAMRFLRGRLGTGIFTLHINTTEGAQ